MDGGIVDNQGIGSIVLTDDRRGDRNEKPYDLIMICDVGEISSKVFHLALKSEIRDFEDGVIEAVALGGNMDLIVTRNINDFKYSKIPAKEPSQLI